MAKLSDVVKYTVESVKAVANDIISGNDVLATDKVKQERLDICRACPLLKKLGPMEQCSVCGCSVVAKASLVSTKCPKDKW